MARKRSAQPRTPRRRMAWDMPGVHLFFHYAHRELAVGIAREALYRVSERAHQRYGCGLFVTNIAPGELHDDDMLIELFAYQRQVEAIEGFIVLQDMGFRQVGAHAWLKSTRPGETIDLTEHLVGWGVRTDGMWTYSVGCIAFG